MNLPLAHGIDLVDFARIESMIEQHGQRFLDRVFTAREQSEAAGVKNRIEKLSGRFAAKEAVMKLVGTGWRGGVAWTDIEVTNGPMGEPRLEISGEIRRVAEGIGIGPIALSITHTANFAIASAVAVRAGS
jgi:holo-[acyl-carrier protein] synthase